MSISKKISHKFGVENGPLYLNEHFFPLPFEKYIIFTGGKYKYWHEALDLLEKELLSNNIRIISMGDSKLNRTEFYNLSDRLTFPQQVYVLKGSLGFLGEYNYLAEISHEVGLTTVCIDDSQVLFGPTIYESKVLPEVLASSLAQGLGLKEPKRKSLFFGKDYGNMCIEMVPNFIFPPHQFKEMALNMRMDYLFDLKFLEENLKMRRFSIVSDKVIPLDLLLKYKNSIVNLYLDYSPYITTDYVKSIVDLGLKVKVGYNGDDKGFEKFKIDFFDFDIEREEVLTKKDLDLEGEDGIMKYATRKFLFSEGKIFLSKVGWLKGFSTTTMERNQQVVFDEPEFWEESNYFYIYK